ncbi:MAG: rRNA maturation RNase YbeY [Cyanobium sp.]
MSGPEPAAEPPELDLAFELDASLDPGLCAAAGELAGREEGESLWQGLLGRWLAELASELPAHLRRPAYSLGLQLCDDDAIASLNETWRQRPGPTDVLAFAAQEEAPPLPASPADGAAAAEPLELGDIVISLETAARQALEQGHPLERELRFLASHGLLHLLGWDHPYQEALTAMLDRQERLLASPGARG